VVRQSHTCADAKKLRGRLREELIADLRMALHDDTLVRSERARLQQDDIGHADLPDIVECGRQPKVLG
jgi:hypothetical protein